MPSAKKQSQSAKKQAQSAGKTEGALTGILLKHLSDPKVMAKILDQGVAVAEMGKRWLSEQKRDSNRVSIPLGDRFGQGKLERRVEHLQLSVDTMATQQPSLAESLAPVSATLQQIGVALTVAGGLPFVKRKRAHLQIDEELDKLEKLIFDASMKVQSPSGSSEAGELAGS